MEARTILAERLRRQSLARPIDDPSEYVGLFRSLQPVSPLANSRPGSPPRLLHRAAFDDGAEADRLRADRRLVKGRFLGGRVGYVLADDLQTYATAFRRPLAAITDEQQTVLDAVRSLGPITPRQLKEETGLLNKRLMPILHRLQEAFLVYEDQPDDDWERGWYDFAREWRDVDLDAVPWEMAAKDVLLRFLRAHVFATPEQFRDWSAFPARALTGLLAQMEAEGAMVPTDVAGLGNGWVLVEDVGLAESEPSRGVFVLGGSDMRVLSHSSELKRRYAGREILQYLLIDGQFRGAVAGHWRIGPHDVDDVIVELSASESAERRDEILAAVSLLYHPPYSHIRRYAGEPVEA